MKKPTSPINTGGTCTSDMSGQKKGFVGNLVKSVMYACILVLVVYGSIIMFNQHRTINNQKDELQKSTELTKSQENAIKELKHIEAKKSFIPVNEDDLMEDIITKYPNVSTRAKKIIITTILEMSEKYSINPLILYSLIHAESSFTAETLHDKRLIYIQKGKKTIKKYIRALGLGGIVYELHGKALREAGIIETRSDLFDPAINVRATAFLYNKEFNKPIKSGAQYRDHSAMLRYFGGNHPIYVKRIEAKIMSIVGPKMYRKQLEAPLQTTQETVKEVEIVKVIKPKLTKKPNKKL